jgi:hypothetical protein
MMLLNHNFNLAINHLCIFSQIIIHQFINIVYNLNLNLFLLHTIFNYFFKKAQLIELLKKEKFF